MPAHSLKARYAGKFVANAVGGCVQLGLQTLFPRALGPGGYGDYSFLANFFTQLTAFFDMGVSLGLYTKLSQRPREGALVGFYRYLVMGISVGILVAVLLLIGSPFRETLWPGQAGACIFAAAVWGALTWASQVVGRMMDAWGLTVSSELIRTAQKLVLLAVVVALFRLGRLDLVGLFAVQNVLLLALCAALAVFAVRRGFTVIGPWRIPRSAGAAYFGEFFTYSSPLMLYGVVSMVTGIFDRWILQIYGGNVQQGYFGLTSQIGAACFLFTSAMTPLIHREFAIAFGRRDYGEMARLFRRYIPLLYAVAAYFSCFVAVQARNVAILFGGPAFEAAAPALALMALYPIHQTYGQLSGSLFFATGRTDVYRNIGIACMVLGLPATYLAVAPASRGGFDGGALGLAVKTLAFQFLAVNLQLWHNARVLRLPFSRYFVHQLGSVAGLFGLAAGATAVLEWMAGGLPTLVQFLGAGLLYTALVAAATAVFPALFGVRKGDVQWLFRKLTRNS